MKLIVWSVLIYLFSFSIHAQISVRDDAGYLIQLDAPAKRIITLAPHLVEIMYAIKAESTLVATVSYSDFPAKAKTLPRVGGYDSVDLEAIVQYRPDLVIAWKSGNNQNQIEKIKKLGISVYLNEPRVLEDVSRTANNLGLLTNHIKEADSFARKFNQQLQYLKIKYQNKRSVKLFYEFWHHPIITINGEHIISDVMALCGAHNIFAEVPVLAPTVSTEAVILANPEIIIIGGTGKKHLEWLSDWKRWPELAAVKQQQLYQINPDLIQRHGPRILQGAEQLCNLVDLARNKLNKP